MMVDDPDECICGAPAKDCHPVYPSSVHYVYERELYRGGTFVLPRRLCLDASGQVVEADDPAARSLLGPAGFSLPLARAVELGLTPG
jgi:hypothetical protein